MVWDNKDVSCDIKKTPTFCVFQKGAIQLHGDHATDHCLCFHNTDCTIYLLHNLTFQANHVLWLYSPVFVGPGSGNPKNSFLMVWLHVVSCLPFPFRYGQKTLIQFEDFREPECIPISREIQKCLLYI